MPYKDSEQRLRASKRWRRRQTPEYFKWLYERRAFRFWKAEKFEEILKQIASGEHGETTPQQLAALWLYEADKKEQEVGVFFNHETNCPSNERTRKLKEKR